MLKRVISAIVTPSRRGWYVGIISALVAFGLPLAVLSWQSSPTAEIRLALTEGGISGWVIAGNQRIAIINTADPAESRALPGRLSKPWEETPTIIVAPASNNAAPGVWEALQGADVQQLLVAGVPGSNPTWLEIERFTNANDIELTYVDRWSKFKLGRLVVAVVADNRDLGTAATIQLKRDETQVSLALSDASPSASGDLAITNGARPLLPADILLSTESIEGWHPSNLLLFNQREVVTIRFTDTGLDLDGARRAPNTH